VTGLADITAGDLNVVFLLLALLGFAVAIYLGYVGNWLAAIVVAIIAVIILAVGV
jgi:hypothetical protein